MGKTNAEKQRAYRERMKARLGEEFLKKERERVKKARTPAALLNKKELAVRRKQQNKWQRKCRALKINLFRVPSVEFQCMWSYVENELIIR